MKPIWWRIISPVIVPMLGLPVIALFLPTFLIAVIVAIFKGPTEYEFACMVTDHWWLDKPFDAMRYVIGRGWYHERPC